MKKLIAALAVSLSATSSFAGGLAEPIMEPEVVTQETTKSAGGIIIPLLLIILVAAALSGGGSNGRSSEALAR